MPEIRSRPRLLHRDARRDKKNKQAWGVGGASVDFTLSAAGHVGKMNQIS